MSMLAKNSLLSKSCAKIRMPLSRPSMRSGLIIRSSSSRIFSSAKSWPSSSLTSIKWETTETMNTGAKILRPLNKLCPFLWWESMSSRSTLRKLNWSTSSNQSSISFFSTKEKEKTSQGKRLEKVFTAWKVVTSIWMHMLFWRNQSHALSRGNSKVKKCRSSERAKTDNFSALICLNKPLTISPSSTIDLSTKRRSTWMRPTRSARW